MTKLVFILRIPLLQSMLLFLLLTTGCQMATITAAPAALTTTPAPSFLPVVTNPAAGPTLAGCPIFPADHIWNTPIDQAPLHSMSDTYIDTIGRSQSFHPDFGAGEWPPGSGSPIGIPFQIVAQSQPGQAVAFTYADESDPGPYPIPPNPLIEGGPNGTGDRHILILEKDSCTLYELFDARPQNGGGWTAGSGAIFDLRGYALRPTGWTSADAAGLPILPGLVRFDEVAAGEINHAIRFTAPQTQRAYLWPARHFASSLTQPQYPPMGLRLRLKADYDISGFSSANRVILQAMKTYGLILADNGSAWFLSGAPDDRWDNDELRQLKQLTGDDFEAIDVSTLQVDPNSGRAK